MTPVLSSSILSALETLVSLTAGEQGGRRRVKVRTKEKCPRCGKVFQHIEGIGIFCLRCKTHPRRYFVDLSFQGKRIRVYSFRDGQPLSSYELAQRARQLIEHEIEKGVFDPSRWVKSDVKKFLIETQWERFLWIKEKQVEAGELSPGYLNQIRSYSKHILGFFKEKDVREIKKADITDFWKYLQEKGGNKKLSPKTINNILRLFKSFLSFLQSEEVISHVPHFPVVKVQKKEPEVFDEEEQIFFLDFVREHFPEHYPILFFMCRQAVRPGEACALLWEDIDLRKGFVWIRRTFSARKLKDNTKGGRHRLIPLAPEVRVFLENYIGEATPFPKNFVFVQPNGSHYKDFTLNRIWNRIKELFLKKYNQGELKGALAYSIFVKLQKGMRLYDATRHSRITQFVAGGKPLPLVQEFAGHSDPRITERYVHLAAEKLKQLFDEEPAKVIPFRKEDS